MYKVISEADRLIGQNILRHRNLEGLDQAALGEALRPPVRAQQISKFEYGYNRLSAMQLVDIARACKCKVSDLLAGVDELVAEGGGFVETITRQEGDLLREYRQIRSPKLKKLVRTMTKALLSETANNLRA